jgi:LAO/AO transport system kinase
MLELAPQKKWRVPVIKTQAAQDQGIDELVAGLEQHRQFLQDAKVQEKKLLTLREAEWQEILQELFKKWVQEELPHAKSLKKIKDQVLSGEISAYEGAHRIFPKIQPKRSKK